MSQKTMERTVPVRKPTDGNAPRRVCFVCTGNTCRSPMAAAVLNALEQERRTSLPAELQELLPRGWVAFSRGLFADGSPIAPNAVQALERAGIAPLPEADYRTHCSAPLLAEEAASCDLICAMTARHALELLLRFPEYAGKICRMPREITDPYGGDLDAYCRCLDLIVCGIRERFYGAQAEGADGDAD